MTSGGGNEEPDRPEAAVDESQVQQRQQENQKRRRRSVAWVYYAILSAVGLYAGFDVNASLLIPGALCALYAVYLFRGGRFVLWIW